MLQIDHGPSEASEVSPGFTQSQKGSERGDPPPDPRRIARLEEAWELVQAGRLEDAWEVLTRD